MTRLFLKLLSPGGGGSDPGDTYLVEDATGSLLMEDGSYLLQE